MNLPETRAIEMEKAIRAGTHDGTGNLDLIGPIYAAACDAMGI